MEQKPIWETYGEVSKRTGLTELQLHRLRIAKIVSAAVIGTYSRIPVINSRDVDRWLEMNPSYVNREP
jgi:hypothetical protein